MEEMLSALLRERKEGRADAVVQVRDTAGEENPKQNKFKRKKTGSALLRERKEGRADAVVQVRDTAGEENPNQNKFERKKTGLAGKTVGRPHQYCFSSLRARRE
ncbi:UNVERIFIED_CONTAM: hypothetical protein FKN15_057206 [Acipenser sinensis]